MANTQTTVPLFVANQVLTANQQNLSAGTGVPVFATTVTRDAAFGGSNKALAEGQLCYIEASNVVQYYDGAAWQPVSATPGLTLISATTIGTAVSSVTVSNAFSATYDAYKIILTGGVSSAGNTLTMVLGASTTTYSGGYIYYNTNGSTSSPGTPSAVSTGTSLWQNVGTGSTSVNAMSMEIQNPFTATYTYMQTANFDPVNVLFKQSFGVHSSNTSYTGFTLATSTGTITGGTIAVYGYAKA